MHNHIPSNSMTITCSKTKVLSSKQYLKSLCSIALCDCLPNMVLRITTFLLYCTSTYARELGINNNFKSVVAPFLRDRPRGLGLLQLPTGMTDERSGPFFPNLYIAGDKAGEKPMSVPDVHLPGQKAEFSGRSDTFITRLLIRLGRANTVSNCFSNHSHFFKLISMIIYRSAFNPFTHAVAVSFNEDLIDSWGAGFAVNVNYTLHLMHIDSICNFSHISNIRKVQFSGHLDLPIPGVNELFDFDGRVMVKGNGNGIQNSAMEFPLTLSDPNERAPYTLKYLNFMADRHMQYGHVVPNVNLFLIGKDKIMDRLTQNRLNPTMIG
uniref:BPI2 domain-containing protein n=1 Tax=Heterorhabditis bacteriophora TaxID=37862 RepID=A0A1I7XUG5_HETBA